MPYEITLVSYARLFTQFFSLLLLIDFFSIHYYVRTILISLPMQRFSLGNVVHMILVLSSQRFSRRTVDDLLILRSQRFSLRR